MKYIKAAVFLLIILVLCMFIYGYVTDFLFFNIFFGNVRYSVGSEEHSVVSNISCKNFHYTMTIAGNGNMTEYIPQEWIGNIVSVSSGWIIPIEEIFIKEGVTSLSNAAFMGCSKLQYIRIPKSMALIGKKAFAYCYSLKSITYCGTMDDWGELIEKSPSWNVESSIEVVVCTDGEIPV